MSSINGISSCSCGVSTWREIRTALRLTREEFAALLHCSVSTIYKIELVPHVHCPHPNTVHFLQVGVRHRAEFRRALLRSPGVYPFVDDLREKAAV